MLVLAVVLLGLGTGRIWGQDEGRLPRKERKALRKLKRAEKKAVKTFEKNYKEAQKRHYRLQQTGKEKNLIMPDGDDLAAAYASLNVFVMPSESETLGFVVMEAMASGVPVVAVRAGGLQDILTDPAVRATNSGELYESGDFAAAGAMTTKLLTDEKERQRQAAGLNEAVQTWSWMASNTKLRDTQYARAFKRHARNQNIKVPIELVDSRRARAWIATEVMGYQWYLQAAAFLFAFGAFAVARSVVASSGALAATGGGQGWSAIGAVQWLVNVAGPLGPAINVSFKLTRPFEGCQVSLDCSNASACMGDISFHS